MPVFKQAQGQETVYGRAKLDEAAYAAQSKTLDAAGSDGTVYGPAKLGTPKPAPTPAVAPVTQPPAQGQEATGTSVAPLEAQETLAQGWPAYVKRRSAEGAQMAEIAAEWRNLKTVAATDADGGGDETG